MRPRGKQLRTARPAFQPPEPEVVDLGDGQTMTDPRTVLERTTALATEPAVQAILSDDVRQKAEDLGLIEVGSAEQIAATVARRLGKRQLTRAQVQRIRLTQRALALRTDGYDSNEIAEALGVSPATVVGWFSTHRRDVASLDLDRQLDEIAVPLATENLIHGLIAGDKDYTLETLKGRGKLRKTVEGGDGDSAKVLPELRIVVEGGNAQINIGGQDRAHHQTQEQITSGGRVVGHPQFPKPAAPAEPKIVDGQVVGRPVE